MTSAKLRRIIITAAGMVALVSGLITAYIESGIAAHNAAYSAAVSRYRDARANESHHRTQSKRYPQFIDIARAETAKAADAIPQNIDDLQFYEPIALLILLGSLVTLVVGIIGDSVSGEKLHEGGEQS